VKTDLLIHSAAQLVTCASRDGPKRGAALADVGLIPGGAVAVSDGEIVDVGATDDLCAAYTADRAIDASGKVVCPGFVDAHTHLVYAGDRADEFEMRVAGVTYMQIMASGGGIVSTMRATRAATVEQLVVESRHRLDEMLSLGTTTVEAKTGYGLDADSEIKMLDAIAALDRQHPIDLVPTFLGAHAVPPEYKGRPDEYVQLVAEEMIPAVARWLRTAPFAGRQIALFCDVFCEAGVFDCDQSRRVLEAGLAHGLPAKLHADEFESLGGVSLAVKLGAVSVDHLDVTVPDEIVKLAASDTIGVLLPTVGLNLGSVRAAPARAMSDAGVALALATDLNPGSAPCLSMPLTMAVACRYGRLLPAEALNASTVNAAYAVGLGDRVGSIQVGKQADLLVLDVPDYRHIAYWLGGNPVEKVIKRGRVVAGGDPSACY
jgi:imidazolonepropionase